MRKARSEGFEPYQSRTANVVSEHVWYRFKSLTEHFSNGVRKARSEGFEPYQSRTANVVSEHVWYRFKSLTEHYSDTEPRSDCCVASRS